MTATLTRPAHAPPRLSAGGIGLVLALHAVAFWALLRMEVIALPAPLAVLSVSLLTPQAPRPPRPVVEPPRPRPPEKRPATLAPAPLQLAAPADSPAPAPVAVAPAPTFVAPPPAAPSAPAPVATTPRFDAAYLDNPKPVYPPLARRMGEEGRVVLRVKVAADGLPQDVALQASSGSARLDNAALDTVRRWKFVPARLGDQAIAAAVLVPIVFSLKD